MKEQQTRKNCQLFMTKLQNTQLYQNVKQLLINWKSQDQQNVPAAIDAFMKITKLIHGTPIMERDEKLIQSFNKCLVKDAIVSKKTVTSDFVEEVACDNPQSNAILENVQQWVKKQVKIIEKPVPKVPTAIEEIKDSALYARLEGHPNCFEIIKIIHLYLKSILSFQQVRSLMAPIYSSDPSLINNLISTSEDIIQKRRKATVFASLNELVDKKYPNLQQVGQSYILIPEGYANYSKTWKTAQLEHIMNRKVVSVPLGSEVSFIINKKTDYEEQLFNYEDQRYEIDNNLRCLRNVVKVIEMSSKDPRKLESVLVQRVINDLYPSENVGNIFIKNPELARNVLLPRVNQKVQQLVACREKFVKICEEIASKNFFKSLDYRCFYFAKNDKDFNCPQRWQKQIQMRKIQILQNKDTIDESQIEDRQSLQRGRYFYVNSFDNITKENFIENKQIQITFDHKKHSTYPAYPQNQILFILNFTNQEVLNDVLQIILYNCSRKNILELLIFKMMRTDINKKLKKSALLNYLLENKQKITNNIEILDIFSKLKNPSHAKILQQQGYPSSEEVLLNDSKGPSKMFKDSEDQFLQMIQEQEQPIQIQNEESPFQGPPGYNLIITKNIYIFMRYVTAIYQRFLKAKQYSEQFSTTMETNDKERPKIDIYKFFLTIMIFKIKDKKYFEENLRKLFCKNAFIFFTLEKMIIGAAKTINNITPDSLTFQIIKDQTKDYELGAFNWEKFTFPSTAMQLTRLYKQEETLFRFTFQPNQRNFYISAWDPPFKQIQKKSQKPQYISKSIQNYTTEPISLPHHIQHSTPSYQKYTGEQITNEPTGKLILRGQITLINKQRKNDISTKTKLKIEIEKLKKLKKLF